MRVFPYITMGAGEVFMSHSSKRWFQPIEKQIEMMEFKHFPDFTATSADPNCYYKVVVPTMYKYQ